MNRFVLVLVLFVCSASFVMAQPKFEMGVVFSTGFPQGDFGQSFDNTGFGVTWDGFYRISDFPISIGGSLGFLTYGAYTRDELFSPTIPVLVPVSTGNNMLLTHFVMRYQPLSRRAVNPYVEGLFGFNYFWNQTTIGEGYDQITATNFSDSALSYGLGGGMSWAMLQGGPQNMPSLFRLDLKLGVRYLFGGQSTYIDAASFRDAEGQYIYDVQRSNTNMLLFDVGMGFAF